MSLDALANQLLSLPPFPAARTGALADRLAALLRTRNSIVLVQGEAIVALEAAALSIARPEIKVLNIVTSPYGTLFGTWLARGGAEVTNLSARPAYPVSVAAVEQALASKFFDIVALVHAESASGILNPLPEISRLAKAHGALLLVDAVASVGGHELDVDHLGIDIAVIGPQKSLGGSSGLAALSISPAAWERIAAPGSLTQSTLSLLDLKTSWLDTGRGALPGMPSALELYALEAALAELEAEGLPQRIARHKQAAAAARAGLEALGLNTFVPAGQASNLVTGIVLPDDLNRNTVLAALARFGRAIDQAIGPGTEAMLRLNHTGRRACHEIILADILALGLALMQLGVKVDPGVSALAITAFYDKLAV